MKTWNEDSIPILQLGPEFYDEVTPARFPKKILRYWNSSVPLALEKDRVWDFEPLADNLQKPLALRYHGHQFQHYNPDLGDGRGFLFAQIKQGKQWYDLGTKGSGQTPYSRRGDGRLTLKGAVREALATELLESLGVNTSKTLCFYETGEQLDRGDEPSPTRSAVLTRYSLGHIRIGTFQRLAFLKKPAEIKRLMDYCIHFYIQAEFTERSFGNETERATYFLKCVSERNAKLVAQVMMAGFVHGVLNTDNINISGELFDYGPYRFLPTYDPNFTAAYFDQQGLYAYGRQPHNFLWNLHQLGFCLQQAFPELNFEKTLEEYGEAFNTQVQTQFLNRLNLNSNDTELTAEIVGLFFKFIEEKKLGFEQTFFDLHSNHQARLETSPQSEAYTSPDFSNLWEKLSTLTAQDSEKINHAYFKSSKPQTLIIDEIENIWKAIDENDDWSLFENKIQSLRRFRGLY